MKTLSKILLSSTLLSLSMNVIAADKTPTGGSKICKWEGDKRVCTTYGQKNKAYGPGFLKPDEVMQCLRNQQQLAATDAKLRADKASFDPESAALAEEDKAMQQRSEAIQAQASKLREQRKDLDSSSAELDQNGAGSAFASDSRQLEMSQQRLAKQNQKIAAFNVLNDAQKKQIDEFNVALKAHSARVEQHNKAAEEMNARIAALKTVSDDFNQHCAQAKSYEDDIKAAEAELAKEATIQTKLHH